MGASRHRLGRALQVLGSPVCVTAAAVVLAVALRLPFVQHVPYPDEGGLLLVAQHWHDGGPRLYGHLFVDRPPALVLFWKLALTLGGLESARLLALLTTAVLVVAAACCGHLLAGRRGTAWAALATAALVGNPLLGTVEVNGELLGAPLTMLSCLALLVVAMRPRRHRDVPLLLLAGALAAGALLVKQNLADAFVLGASLALASAATGAWSWGRATRFLGLGAVGALVPLAGTAVWAQTHGPGLPALWFTLYQFRLDAAGVMVRYSSSANDHRALTLLGLTFVTGLALVVLPGLWVLGPRARRGDPLALAVFATVVFEALAVMGGGAYWSHYLIGLVPGVALVASAAAAAERRRPFAVVPGLVVVLASALVMTSLRAAADRPPDQHQSAEVAAWLRDAARPGDSALVTYGHADVLMASGLTPRYPFLWTLPLRTLDPHLDRLVRRLDGRHPPTWVLRWSYLDSWGLDPRDRVAAALAEHYRLARTVCGVPVYLHRGEPRRLPVAPDGCVPG
ncbi:hypothetical protein GCM10009844_08910 [Nocardioides koreensis]|uniref:Glycosyltransferase RgtA/B/C/D-like domain-containing protein n=1 Tax=Nocardioides koreensis TaxID=433651 RepID=A0ABN2ZBN2_9ACTN